MSARKDRYTTVAIVLHWLIAAAIIFQVSLAGRMEGPFTPKIFAVVQLHKSVGIAILLLSLARLAWRLMNPPPPYPEAMKRWEKGLATTVHVGLYVVMIGMPLTGWLLVSASKLSIPTVLFGVVPWPHIPGLAGLDPAAKEVWAGIGDVGHDLLAKVLYVLVGLHVAGALKHQFLSKDEPVLAQMAPGAKPGRWLEPRLLLILLGVIAAGAFAKVVTPPAPKSAALPAPAAEAPVAAPTSAPSPTPSPAPSSGPEPAPTGQEAAVPPPAAPAGVSRWGVDHSASTLAFSTSWGGDAIQGRFAKWTAGIVFGPDALDKSSVKVYIDLGSVQTGDAQRDSSLPAGDWFDTANHPEALFTADRFEKTGEGKYVARGVLELRGVKKPQSLPFTLQIDGDKARMHGVTSLDRTAFGVGQGEWAKTDEIPAKVTVTADIRATRR